MPDFLSWLLIFPILILIVCVHEFGHFITAKLSGVKVDEFGIGFPPRIYGKSKIPKIEILRTFFNVIRLKSK